MMMRALIAGGLKGAYDPEMDKVFRRWSTEAYDVNPYGFYELDPRKYKEKDFPKQYEGQLIKILHGGLKNIALGKYKIVYMLRDTKEIEASMSKLQGKTGHLDPENYKKWMDDVINWMKNRRDCKIIVFQYNEVVATPLSHFAELKELGWPIDPEKAASTIDKKLYRNKN